MRSISSDSSMGPTTEERWEESRVQELKDLYVPPSISSYDHALTISIGVAALHVRCALFARPCVYDGGVSTLGRNRDEAVLRRSARLVQSRCRRWSVSLSLLFLLHTQHIFSVQPCERSTRDHQAVDSSLLPNCACQTSKEEPMVPAPLPPTALK